MQSYVELNNQVLSGTTVDTRFDQAALQAYFQDEINPNTVFFHSIHEKIKYMTEHGFWDADMLGQYAPQDIKSVFQKAYGHKFRFKSFMGAHKFYSEYATKNADRTRWLELYEDRMAITALARSGGNPFRARRLVSHLVRQTFTPATPTLMNSGKANTGRLVSCFLLQDCTDSMNAITQTIAFAADLSKNGGGIGISLDNLRARRENLKKLAGVTKGAAAVAKLFDVLLRYADQAGQRQGAGVVYLNVMHPDFLELLGTKKIATDEDARLKTLSIGAVIPDVFMYALKEDRDFYQVYPHSFFQATGREFTSIDWDTEYAEIIANPAIKKVRLSARKVAEEIAVTQGESGYPYLLFSGNANRANPLSNVGSIKMSNLCTEILQPTLPSFFNGYNEQSLDTIGLDVSCNLASVHVENAMATGDLDDVVNAAMDMLDDVSRSTHIGEVPAVARANQLMRSVGLGAMGLHSYLAKNSIVYGSAEALDFCNVFFAAMHFFARRRSMEIARDSGFIFEGFSGSDYESGAYFQPYLDQSFLPQSPEVGALFGDMVLPTPRDWRNLVLDIQRFGLAHSHVMAVAPTGSISYVSNASASVMPITERVETRTSAKGRTIYPMPHLSAETEWFYEEAYDMDQRRVIDTVAAIQRHVDQGISCTLFVPSTITTAELTALQIYAYRKGLKTLYYTRMRQASINECVSCAV